LEPLRIPDDLWRRDDVRQALDCRDIGRLFQLLHKYAGASQTRIGIAVGMAQATVSMYMSGTRVVTAIDVLERVAQGLAMPDEALVRLGLAPSNGSRTRTTAALGDDELDALELGRRAAASDIGEETLTRLGNAADDLATGYPVPPPQMLLGRVRRHLGYVADLLDARKTLDEYRRLLVVGGWLSLLAATLHIDLKQHRSAQARLATAAALAKQTGHAELYAWCFETQAWSVLTDGDYRRAVDLSQTAQRLAPRGSSAAIQATAQEGRAWARMGSSGRQETYHALRRNGGRVLRVLGA